MIHTGAFVTPFLLAAALQTAYLVLYRHYFGALDGVGRD
jgi:hypothetical protein